MTLARILVVDDEIVIARELQARLCGMGHEVVGIAATAQQAIDLAVAKQPDLALMDINLKGAMDGIGAATEIRRRCSIPIIYLTAFTDEQTLERARVTEPFGYLVKPFAEGALRANIEMALHKHKSDQKRETANQAKKGNVVAVLGAKGGVGTTTVAINLAASLASQGRSVIAVELRPCFGTLVNHLRRSAPAENLRTLLDLGAGELSAKEIGACLCAASPRLRVLFGPQTVGEFKDIQPEQVTALVGGLTRLADIIVLDLPCQPSDATRAALQQCDHVALVVEREPSCVAAARVTQEMLKSWKVDEASVGAVLVNRVSLSLPMKLDDATSAKLDDVTSALGFGMTGVIPPAAHALAAALQATTPLVLCQPQHMAAVAMAAVATKLCTKLVVR